MGKSLEEIVKERPFYEFSDWWRVGDEFAQFMSEAIVDEWRSLSGNSGEISIVRGYARDYVQLVYDRSIPEDLVDRFVNRQTDGTMQSGEFDALSYAFYRSAFEIIQDHSSQYQDSVVRERRLFTKRVGKRFFGSVQDFLRLGLPSALTSASELAQANEAIGQVGAFLHEQGYLRSHFAFRFDVEITHAGRQIQQGYDDVLENLSDGGTAFALYEMGYPIILPSAVYLYHTMGEAQHHSSRTIEDLFETMGFDARETDDFDPIGYPSDLVVELWEIRKS